MKDYRDIVTALAGVCQAAVLVNRLATEGEISESDFGVAVNSLLVRSPETTLEVFGGQLSHLKTGLEGLIGQLNNADGNSYLTRYWLSLIGLEGKLNKNAQAKETLGKRIARLPEQLSFYSLEAQDIYHNEQALAAIAGIYSDVISPLGNKIHIVGKPELLAQPLIQHQIRTCLLAGIRAAVLWRQMGGGKLQLLFSRAKLVRQAQDLFSSIY